MSENVPTEQTTAAAPVVPPPTPPTTTASDHPYLIPLLVFLGGVVVTTAVIFGSPFVATYLSSNTEPQSTTPENIEEFENMPNTSSSEPETSAPNFASSTTDFSQYYKNLVQRSNVTWVTTAEAVPDRGFLVNNEPEITKQVEYFRLGTYDDRSIYAVVFDVGEMGSYPVTLFFLDQSSTAPVTLLSRHSMYNFSEQYSAFTLSPTVVTDDTITLSAFDYGNSIMLTKGIILTTKNPGFGGGVPIYGSFSKSSFVPSNDTKHRMYQSVEFVEDTPYGPLFRGYTKSEDGTTDLVYGLRTIGGLVSYFDIPVDYITNNRVPQITWLDGSKNTFTYRTDSMGGCGGGGPLVAVTPIGTEALERVGLTATNKDVYRLTDINHPIMKRIYGMTEGRIYVYDSVTQTSDVLTITPEEFLRNRGIIVVYDDFGYQNIYVHGEYGPQAECAKPVIYLYPETPTTISVQVDAQVTKSDPAYNNGWTAFATPDGQLTVGGAPYDSLFWDGLGNGTYPDLTTGFSAPTEEALTRMGEQLAYMGFNEREIADFKEFWKDHLPSQPYTTWSWIETKQMQDLAALTISPRPQTLIRAFVDFSGSDQPATMSPQTLTPRTRTGYVATEWGGILRK